MKAFHRLLLFVTLLLAVGFIGRSTTQPKVPSPDTTAPSSTPPVFVAAWGTSGSGDGQFNGPIYVAVDGSGNVYVADETNNRIQKFSSTGTYLTQWGTAGTGNGQFARPFGVAVDGSGNVYVVDFDNYRIQKFSSTGTYLTQWGTLGRGNGQFLEASGVAVDGSDNVYVADYQVERIQKFTSTGAYLTQWGTNGTGNGQFKGPNGVAVDGSGNVYVADYANNRIQKFTSTGTRTGEQRCQPVLTRPNDGTNPFLQCPEASISWTSLGRGVIVARPISTQVALTVTPPRQRGTSEEALTGLMRHTSCTLWSVAGKFQDQACAGPAG